MNWELYLPLYIQLVGVGFLWVTFHCAGMCGPIIAGLTNSHRLEGTTWQRVKEGGKYVLAYQSGRGIMYMILGALAGMIGITLQTTIRGISETMSLFVAAGLLIVGVYKLPFIKAELNKKIRGPNVRGQGFSARLTGRVLGSTMKTLNAIAPRRGIWRLFAFGFLLGLLPCMLMFWALGLAASSAHPVHGALLMLGLVIMTTPTLLIAGCGSVVARASTRRLGDYIIPVAIIFSGIWLSLIGAAANMWIPHLHVPFTLFGEKLVIMFW